MAKNSLYGWDQRKPCTWKCFKSPKLKATSPISFINQYTISVKWKGKVSRCNWLCPLDIFKGFWLLCQLQKTQRALWGLCPGVLSIACAGLTSFPQKKKPRGKTPFLVINNSVHLLSIPTVCYACPLKLPTQRWAP